MVDRLVAHFAAFTIPEKSSEFSLAAYVRRSTETPGDADPLARTVLVAAAQDLDALLPLRAANRSLLDHLAGRSSARPQAAILMFALDGLWLSELLGISPLNIAERAELVEALRETAERLDQVQS